MNFDLEIFVDGACRGNPGEASVGVVVKRNGKIVKEIAEAIGEATNNIAEYTALIYALKEAIIQKAHNIKIYTDSELMHSQLTGRYQIKNEKLKPLYTQANELAAHFGVVEIKHVPREENQEADKLASSVLKKKQAKVVASTSRFKVSD